MHNTLVLYTFIALIIFFLALEIYKLKFYIRGTIVEFCSSKIGIDDLICSQLIVKLEDGQTVKAEAERCTMCMGQFSIGDEVRLIKSNNRYVVHLPFNHHRSKICN